MPKTALCRYCPYIPKLRRLTFPECGVHLRWSVRRTQLGIGWRNYPPFSVHGASGMPKRKKELTIEDMWKSYLKSRSVAMRNKIVVHYSHLVHTHAARLSRKLPAQVSYDEICSAAFDGLIEAVEAYDPERKAKFETFCQQRISGAVMDWLRSLDPQSRTVRTFERRTTEARESLGTDLEYGPSNSELAGRLEMSLARFDYLSRLSQLGKEVHFSAMEPPADRRGEGTAHTWDIRDQTSGRSTAEGHPRVAHRASDRRACPGRASCAGALLFRGDDHGGDRQRAEPVGISRQSDPQRDSAAVAASVRLILERRTGRVTRCAPPAWMAGLG